MLRQSLASAETMRASLGTMDDFKISIFEQHTRDRQAGPRSCCLANLVNESQPGCTSAAPAAEPLP
ncbi:MAG: hypothetical protein QOH49_2323 [Acidobacteriota bacterium]|jgi:hypothetical protein|nr:hypothetical protein [Acidobacteriota bacterium]